MTSTPAAANQSPRSWQHLTHELKPMEVEILVAEVTCPAGDQMFHLLYDGTVMDQKNTLCSGRRGRRRTHARGLPVRIRAAARLGGRRSAGPNARSR
jgi:hypothetical protein